MVYKRNIPGYVFKCALSLLLAFFVLTGTIFFSTYVVGNRGVELCVITEGSIIDFVSYEAANRWWQEQSMIHHFDEPIFVQYFRWMGNLLSGNWGNSYVKRVPVWDLVF